MDIIFFGANILRELWFGYLLLWLLLAGTPIGWFLANLDEKNHVILPLLIFSVIGILYSMAGIRAFYLFSWWEAILGFSVYLIIGMLLSRYHWSNFVIQLRNQFLVVLNQVQMEHDLDLNYFKNNSQKTDNKYYSHFRTLRDRLGRNLEVDIGYGTDTWEELTRDITPRLKNHRMKLSFIVMWWPFAVALYLVTDGAVATWRAILNWFNDFYSSSSKKYLNDTL